MPASVIVPSQAKVTLPPPDMAARNAASVHSVTTVEGPGLVKESYSYAPISAARPNGRGTPRWSVGGAAALSPASIARLLGSNAIVAVGPPLLVSGPSNG